MYSEYFPHQENTDKLTVLLQRTHGAVLGPDTQAFATTLRQWSVAV